MAFNARAIKVMFVTIRRGAVTQQTNKKGKDLLCRTTVVVGWGMKQKEQ